MIISNLLTFLLIFEKSHCYRILAFLPIASKSHHLISVKIVDQLAKNGHQVTFVSSEIRENPPENVTEIAIKAPKEWLQEIAVKMTKERHSNCYERLKFVEYFVVGATKYILGDMGFKEFLESGQRFDVTIVSEVSASFLAVGRHFQTPIVVLSTTALFPWTKFRLGYPDQPSWMTNVFSNRIEPKSFWQRLQNSFNFLRSILYVYAQSLPEMRRMTQEHFPKLPDLYKILKDVDLVLINTHFSNHETSVQFPNFIEIAGYHLEPPKPLALDLQRFLDRATNGVIVFAMGSHVKISLLPNETLNVFFKTFSELNQTVLMKWEADEAPKAPPNVRFLKWLPMKDLLGHVNVKLFITHGGVFSTIEALSNGVPVLGIPASLDQISNMDFAEHYRYGKLLNLPTLTHESLLSTLTEMLYNPSFKRNAILRSEIIRDRIRSPIDAVNYWIECVVRRRSLPRKQIENLRYPGLQLEWYQVYLLDVFFAIFAFILLICVSLERVLNKYFKSYS